MLAALELHGVPRVVIELLDVQLWTSVVQTELLGGQLGLLVVDSGPSVVQMRLLGDRAGTVPPGDLLRPLVIQLGVQPGLRRTRPAVLQHLVGSSLH